MADILSGYAATLQGLRRRARLRELEPRRGVDFTSNDFLAVADSPRLKAAIIDAVGRGVPAGSGGSRLLRGNHPEHEALEAEAAAFFGAERSLYFGSGYAANSSLFSTLPRRDDLVVHDELVHASAREGISASKAASVGVAHNDADAFDRAIRRWRDGGGKGRPWIAVESLYSMEGDRAPLRDLAQVALRHDGVLVVDEAHATGVCGEGGRGLAAGLEVRDGVIALHTCGKALGLTGALIVASGVLADYLVNRARAFIYSTAPSPLVAAGVRESLRIVAEEPGRRVDLQRLASLAGEGLESRLGIRPSGSQIQPVVIGDNARALRVAERLQSEGFDVRAIRPPTVPEGTARLRISITLNVGPDQIASMIDALAAALQGEGV